MTVPQNCPGCGAPFESQGSAARFCNYCGTQIVLQQEVVQEVEVVKSESDAKEQADQASAVEREKIYAEIDRLKALCDRTEVFTIPIFLGLVAPGFFGGFFGTIMLGTSGQVLPAIACGVVCGILLVVGVTLLIYFSKKKERAEEQIKLLETRLGKDTRSFGEKILDKGLGWMFGKKS